MLLFLEDVARYRGIAGSVIVPWVTKFHSNICTIGATSIKSTVSRSMVLNQNIQSNSLSSMHGKTLNAMAREGVEAIFFSHSPPPTVYTPTTVPSFDKPEMVKCLACDKLGIFGTPCTSLEYIGMIYD